MSIKHRQTTSTGMGIRLVYAIGAAALAIGIVGSLLSLLSVGVHASKDRPSSELVVSFEQFGAEPALTVTAPTDSANGNTTSVAALLADPGPDGISIREAMVASNNTPGPERIEFVPALSGTAIMIYQNGALPILTGGGLTINGDINRDGKPDVTLDGSLGQDGGPTSNCFSIWSDDNIIAGMNITGFRSAILFGVPDFYLGTSFTMSNNQILSNTITGKNGVSVSPCGWIEMSNPSLVSNLTWAETLIAGNEITASEASLMFLAGTGTSQHNRILTLTVRENQLYGEGEGIVMLAGDTNSLWFGLPEPVQYADDNLIENVDIANNTTPEIKLVASNMGNQGNRMRHLRVLSNTVGEGGIGVSPCYEVTPQDGRPTSLNVVSDVDIRGNTVQGAERGITLHGSGRAWGQEGPVMSDNVLEDAIVVSNTVIDAEYVGIMVVGGEKVAAASVMSNVVSEVAISNNYVSGETRQANYGILVAGGWDKFGLPGGLVSGNVVSDVHVLDNVVSGSQVGLQVVGGINATASGNRVEGGHCGNTLRGNGIPFMLVEDLSGAVDNEVVFPPCCSFNVFLPLIVRRSP